MGWGPDGRGGAKWLGVLRALRALRLAGGLLRKEKEAGPPQAGSDWDPRLTTHIKTTSSPSSP